LPTSWTIVTSPGGIVTTGNGTSTVINNLTANTIYSFTITNASSCNSAVLNNIVINPQPPTPSPPSISTITQPTCTTSTGNVTINNLPASGNYIITSFPVGDTITSNGPMAVIGNLSPNTNYSFLVTNTFGCTSSASANVFINQLSNVLPISTFKCSTNI
jgi:hypothetical protein